ncbi:MAG: right-handed parallel beta-helix repeat-containing protein [Planctomycetes bacterium]|nr:right-handed parallel beta-helix repeat-containing protein [Planctomycetota bacterium]
MRWSAVFSIGLWAATALSAQAAGVYFVDSRADGADDGSSWANAFTDLQDALDAAGAGEEIWVAGGPYYPTRDVYGTPNGRANTFTVREAPRVYGGFLGIEVDRTQRTTLENLTVLAGETQSYRVVTIDSYNGARNGLVFDGFIVTGGYADGDGKSGLDYGAGMAIFDVDAIIANCWFVANHATSGGGAVKVGAYNARFVNCRFTYNSAGDNGYWGVGGAALGGWGGAQFVNCLFAANFAGIDGVGHAAYFASDYEIGTRVVNCTFSENGPPAPTGLGGAIAVAGMLQVHNSVLWGNHAEYEPSIASTDPNDVILVTNSDVEGGFVGQNIIVADPMFANPLNDSFRLVKRSPCVDLSDPAWLPPDWADLDLDGDVAEPLPLDLDLTPRIIGEGPNLGCFETFDCQGDNVGDYFQISSGESFDCDYNEIPDECDIRDCPGDPFCADCNANGRLDGCEIDRSEGGLDCNRNNWLDECEGPQGVLYVDSRAPAGGFGDSWPQAYPDLENALCIARAQPLRVFQVWVAAGRYAPAAGEGRSDGFRIPGNVLLLGGFRGDEDNASLRDPAANATILSGDVLGNDGTDAASRADNAWHVIIIDRVTGSPLIDGFTIRGGQADALFDPALRTGGGIRMSGGSAIVRHCRFEGNHAAEWGGAIALVESSVLTIQSTTFEGNTAAHGAALAAADASVFVINTVITGSSGSPSVCEVSMGASVTLLNCTVADNAAATVDTAAGSFFGAQNSILWNNAASELNGAGTLAIQSCNVRGGAAGDGNTNVEPLIDAAHQLLPGSPCLDAGNNDLVSLLPTDAAGRPRIQNCRVDLGAYESELFGDCDGNGRSDACEAGENPAIDCDHDGRPDRCRPDYSDCNNDGMADFCQPEFDFDADNDGVPDCIDNCPSKANADQRDGDHDGLGDACDSLLTLDPCPGDVTVAATDASGAIVRFTLPIARNGYGTVSVAAIPPSGANFPIGTTTVAVTARDDGGGNVSCTFSVLVLAPTDDTSRPPADQQSEEDCPPLYRMNSGALRFFGLPVGCGPGCLVSVPLVFLGLVGMKGRVRRRRN